MEIKIELNDSSLSKLYELVSINIDSEEAFIEASEHINVNAISALFLLIVPVIIAAMTNIRSKVKMS